MKNYHFLTNESELKVLKDLLPNLQNSQSLLNLFLEIIDYFEKNKKIALLCEENYLTTPEAANILEISRPHLYSLMDSNKIPFSKFGTHRRIRLEDLLEYKKNRENSRKKTLSELLQINKELQLYKENVKQIKNTLKNKKSK